MRPGFCDQKPGRTIMPGGSISSSRTGTNARCSAFGCRNDQRMTDVCAAGFSGWKAAAKTVFMLIIPL